MKILSMSSFLSGHLKTVIIITLSILSLSTIWLPRDNVLAYPGLALNYAVGSLSFPWGDESDRDSVGVTFYKSSYNVTGIPYIKDAFAFLENPIGTNTFLREAVSETAAGRSGISRDDPILNDDISIVLFNLQSYSSVYKPEMSMRLNKIESSLNKIYTDKTKRATAKIHLDANKVINENARLQTILNGNLQLH